MNNNSSATSDASIFQRYFGPQPAFVDRHATSPDDAVDVIVPVVHSTELWRPNLLSIYREVPVNRLLLGDGGCVDDTIAVAREFPRVEVFDHRAYKTLGYSIRKLIEAVTTDWFIYVHSDVYLPEGWFDTMAAHRAEYDWFGCPERMTVLVEYHNINTMGGIVRPFAGSQMGRKAAFIPRLDTIGDDYVYRQEDFVFADVVTRAGFKEGRVEDTFHYHQLMRKESPWARKLSRVSVQVDWSREERIRASTMQVRGIIKYLQPSAGLMREVEDHLVLLLRDDALRWDEFVAWVRTTNAAWIPYLGTWRVRVRRVLGRRSPKAILRQMWERVAAR